MHKLFVPLRFYEADAKKQIVCPLPLCKHGAASQGQHLRQRKWMSCFQAAVCDCDVPVARFLGFLSRPRCSRRLFAVAPSAVASFAVAAFVVTPFAVAPFAVAPFGVAPFAVTTFACAASRQ